MEASYEASLVFEDIVEKIVDVSCIRFSIIVISCNQEDFVVEALESVLTSSFRDIEVICVDDGSTDGTVELLQEIARSDSRVVLATLNHSGKPSVSRTAGVRLAKGEYLCFLDGDDIVDSRRFELLHEAIGRTSEPVDLLFSDYCDFIDGTDYRTATPRLRDTADGRALHEMATVRLALDGSKLHGGATAWTMDSKPLSLFLLARSFVINTGTVCIRRKHFDAAAGGFPVDRTVGEDNVVWFRCLLDSLIVFVDVPLFYWRKHPRSITALRSPESQRELVASMIEMATLASGIMAKNDQKEVYERIYEEKRDIGVLLEEDGHRWQAVMQYLVVAKEYRKLNPLIRVAKALSPFSGRAR